MSVCAMVQFTDKLNGRILKRQVKINLGLLLGIWAECVNAYVNLSHNHIKVLIHLYQYMAKLFIQFG